MREEDKEIINLSVKQILLFFLDITAGFAYLTDMKSIHKKSFADYAEWHFSEAENFRQKIHYLKRKKLINIIIENKEKYLVPTEKGREKIKKYFLQDFKIKEFKKWDGRWRIVIFDIPNDKKVEREQLRMKLVDLGFFKLQESVFVYPFECKEEIDFLKKVFYIKPYVQYIVADTIETEKDILTHFFENEILSKEKCKNLAQKPKSPKAQKTRKA